RLTARSAVTLDLSMSALTARIIDLSGGSRVVVLNDKDAEQLGVLAWDRVRIRGRDDRSASALVDITKSIVPESQIGLPGVVAQELMVVEGESVTVQPALPPVSVKWRSLPS